MTLYEILTTEEFEKRFEKLTKKNRALIDTFAKAILKLERTLTWVNLYRMVSEVFGLTYRWKVASNLRN